jgi:uncharacterized protein
MKYWLYKLIPPRATFPADMTPDEGRLMQEHLVYWKGLMRQGMVLAIGPVGDPRGAYGIGLLRLDDGVAAEPLAAADPVVAANLGFRYEIHPMMNLILPEHLAQGPSG